jgi:hypothetical protein
MPGERRKPALGLYGELTVEQARSLAQTWLAEVRRGGDPGGDKTEARRRRPSRNCADVSCRTIPRSATSRARRKAIRATLTATSSILGRMKVQDVKRPDVAMMMKTLEPTPMEANHTLAVMRKMFNMAEFGACGRMARIRAGISPNTLKARPLGSLLTRKWASCSDIWTRLKPKAASRLSSP